MHRSMTGREINVVRYKGRTDNETYKRLLKDFYEKKQEAIFKLANKYVESNQSSKFDKVKYIKYENNISMKNLINRNVPSIIKGLIQFIETRLNSETVLQHNKYMYKDTFLKIESHDINQHEWLKINEYYPEKTGIYYVSDGQNVAAGYFNRTKKVFHIASKLNISLWSTRKVTLPQ